MGGRGISGRKISIAYVLYSKDDGKCAYEMYLHLQINMEKSILISKNM